MKTLKKLWFLIRISLEFYLLWYASALATSLIWLVFKIQNDDAGVTATNILALALTIALEFLWRRLKQKKQNPSEPIPKPKSSPQPTQPLQVSSPPTPTGQSTYVMLKPKACLAAKKYVMLDTETTGFSSTSDRVIEIGMIKCVDDKPVDSFTTFVNPDMHIPSNISRLTGITDADVASAPQFQEIAQQVIDFIGELPVVAHNGHFDARMLASEFDYMGQSVFLKVIDTLPMARKAFPDLKNHKLRTLIDELQLADYEQKHRALDDARIGHLLYLRCKEELSK